MPQESTLQIQSYSYHYGITEYVSKQNEDIMNKNKMETMPVNKHLITMAAPMVLSMLIGALYNVVDSLFVSHYGEKALSVVSLAFQNILSSNAFSILLDILAEEI